MARVGIQIGVGVGIGIEVESGRNTKAYEKREKRGKELKVENHRGTRESANPPASVIVADAAIQNGLNGNFFALTRILNGVREQGGFPISRCAGRK